MAHRPKSRTEFWDDKFKKNKERDARNLERLAAEGWTALTVWECEMKDAELLTSKVTSFLEGRDAGPDFQPTQAKAH